MFSGMPLDEKIQHTKKRVRPPAVVDTETSRLGAEAEASGVAMWSMSWDRSCIDAFGMLHSMVLRVGLHKPLIARFADVERGAGSARARTETCRGPPLVNCPEISKGLRS